MTRGLEVHHGGTATCKEKAVCVDCGQSYGGLGDHAYGTLIPAQAEVHTQTDLKAGVAAHYFCDVCDTYFTEGKVETTLEALTGDAPEHSYGNWITTDADNHWKACSCGLKAEIGAHVYDGDRDATCNTCGHERVLAHEHTFADTLSYDANNHWYASTCGHDVTRGLESHHGGTATCKEKAVCVDCGQSYGGLGVHTDKLQWIQTPATHKQIYVCCGTVFVNETSHDWGEDNICTTCHYGCTHTYENPVFVWQADFSAAKITVTCSNCEDVKELNCEISSQWDADTLTFTATAGEYTDTQTIQLAVVGGKLTITNSAAEADEAIDMIIMIAGYTSGGKMTGCQVIEDVSGVTEQNLTFSGDTVKVFFLKPGTYAPLFACAEL